MTSVRRRSAPLQADGHQPPPERPDLSIGHDGTTRQRTEDDRQSFIRSVRGLRTRGGTLGLSERTLMILGGVLAPLGLVIVLLGWVGASRTSNLFEQVPYMISGGLFGLGLVFLGSFFYFAHWITELVKENRAHSAAVLGAMEDLLAEIRTSTTPRPAPAAGPVELVATLRGSMAHRPECVVVAGKTDLRMVDADEALMPCKLCEPYAQSVSPHPNG